MAGAAEESSNGKGRVLPDGVSKTILLLAAEGGDHTDISWNPENDCPIAGADSGKVSLNLCRQYLKTPW